MQQLLEILGKIGFDWHMSLFNLANFLVAFWVLKKFAFGPLVKIINERQKKAQEVLENFDKSQAELSMAKQNAKQIVDEGKTMVNYLMSEAQTEAKNTVEGAKIKAKEETQKVVEEAKKTIQSEKEKMKEKLYEETADLIVAATEKIFTDNLKASEDVKYVKKVVEDLKK
ncbi:MAG TPA: F0F1 ATP synthase subunit B [Candidatus Magasanikbacteria bacterium]|nr:F0F1 ATP synthase subunit B [Candidatus Magasanikbacteria bacterium]